MSCSVTIAGSSVTVIGSIQIQDAVQQRSTATFTVHDTGISGVGTYGAGSYGAGTYGAASVIYSFGMPVVISDSTNGTLFTGYVNQAGETKLVPNVDKSIAIQAMDLHYLADKRRVTYDYTNMAAGDIATDLLSNYLSAEGITAGYAYKHVTTNTDWSSGATLTNTSATPNVGDGDLELSKVGSDTSKTFANTLDWTTGTTLTSIDAGATGQTANQINLQAYSAIKFTGTNVGNLGNCYAYWEVGTYTAITISSGDTLTYDVWVSSTSPAIQAAVDCTFTDGYTLRDFNSQGMVDQNSIHAHPGSDLTGFADDQWYHRSIDLTAVAGKQIAIVTIAFEGDAGGDYTAYFRNIRHNTSGGTSRHTYFNSTANAYTPASQTIESNYLVSANGYSNLHTSSVTVYDKVGTWTSPAISVDAVKIVKSSLISWQSFVPAGITPATTTGSNAPAVPTGTALTLFTSIDDTGTWQPAPFNASIPNLAPGFKVASRNIYVRAVLAITNPSPEISPIVTKAQTTVTSSWVQTKTDSITICKTQSDFNTGNYSATSYYTAQNNSLYFDTADSGVSLFGYWEGFDTLTGTTPNVTTWGTNSPVSYTDHRQLHLQCGGSSNDARLQFTAATANSFQNFTAQISFSFTDASRENGCGLVYRTTGWQNNNDTYAYTAMMVCNQGHGSTPNTGPTTIQLGRGTNSNSGAGTYTSLANVTLPFNAINGNTYTLKIVINSTTHKVYLDDVLWTTVTDSTYNFVGGVGVRYYNNTGATNAGTFDNFGIGPGVTNPLSGTWDNGSGISLGSTIGTAGNSIVAWDAAITTGCTLLTETSINGGSTWQTATSGAAIPNLGPGTNTTGVNVQIRFTMTSTYPSVTPILKGWYIWITTKTNASGTRVSPALDLTNVGRAGSTLYSVNSLLPTNTSLGLDISTDRSTWTDLTDAASTTYSAALPTAVIYTQPDPYLDFFPADTHTNYTASNFASGGAATWTFDTANQRLVATQTTSVNGTLEYTTFVRKDMYVEAAINKSDSGGLIVRAVDASNAYYISIADASAGSNPNTVQLKKIVSGSISNVGSAAAITFNRGEFHVFRLDAQGTAIKVYMDNAQIISQTDSGVTAAGKGGFLAGITNGHTLQAYYIRVQPYGDDVTKVWSNTSYLYKKQIVIDHTKVSGSSNLSNFPMLVSLTDTDLKTVSNGGKIQNSSGFDIIFVNSTETAKLDHEIERYVATTGEIEMWVRIPTLSYTADTVIYLYFDNASISSSQENVTGVWDSNYKGVYHLGNGTTLSVTDSTGNANNGTNHGATATTGQIDGGANFNGSSQYISVPTAGFPTGAGAFSLQCWIKISSQLHNYEEPFSFGTHTTNNDFGFWFDLDYTIHAGFDAAGDIQGPIPSLNTWHKLTATYNGSTLTYLIDGASVGNTTTTSNILLGNAVIGANQDLGFGWFPGLIDEARHSNIARSNDWDATEYNNQFSPSTFYSVGTITGIGKILYTRQRLASTDPTVTPQLTDMTLSVHDPNIGDGATIGTTAYATVGQNMYQVSQALDDLAKQSITPSQFTWYVEKFTKKLHFHQQQAIAAPFYVYSDGSGLNNGKSGNIQASTLPTVTRPDMLYRNRQTVDGGIDVTSTIDYTVPTDGFTQAWPMQYAVNATPTITLDGVAQTVGVQGIDSGKQFYYQVGSTLITQDTSGVPVAKTDTLIVSYIGQFQVRVTRNNVHGTGIYAGTVGQTQLGAIDNSSGIVEDYVAVPGLNKTQAEAYADALLVQYGKLGILWNFTTLTYGIQPGMLITASVAEYGIVNQPLVVTKVTTTAQYASTSGNVLYRYAIESTSGAILKDYEVMLPALMQAR